MAASQLPEIAVVTLPVPVPVVKVGALLFTNVAVTFWANSEVSVKVVYVASDLVAVALMIAPLATAAESTALMVALPLPLVATLA